jgi:stage III sporulation protein AG
VETVLSDSGSGLETPLVVQETYPVYQGALVLCQGADNAAVRLDIVSAISGLTGLGADKITVIKMED